LSRQNARQSLQSRSTGERREQLLNAAAKVVLDHGAGNLTLDAVSEAAHVSKGGLLYYFDGKGALLEALVDDLATQLEVEADDDPHACLRAVASMSELPRSQHLRRALASICAAHPEFVQHLRSRASRRATLRWGKEMSVHELHLRLLADGLWLADVSASYRISPERRRELLELVMHRGYTSPQ